MNTYEYCIESSVKIVRNECKSKVSLWIFVIYYYNLIVEVKFLPELQTDEHIYGNLRNAHTHAHLYQLFHVI